MLKRLIRGGDRTNQPSCSGWVGKFLKRISPKNFNFFGLIAHREKRPVAAKLDGQLFQVSVQNGKLRDDFLIFLKVIFVVIIIVFGVQKTIGMSGHAWLNGSKNTFNGNKRIFIGIHDSSV